MDIQKEFEKWSNSKVIAFGEELTWKNGQPTYEECWNACATLMADRVKELEAEILNKEKSWYTEFPDEKSAQDVFNIIKDLQAENKKLEAEIKELKEQVTDLTNGNYKKGIHTCGTIKDEPDKWIPIKADKVEGEK